MDEYAEAKYRICANQSMSDWFVGNLDDPRIEALAWRHGNARVQARQLWFTRNGSERATMYLRDGAGRGLPPRFVASRDTVVRTDAAPSREGRRNRRRALR